MRRGTDDQNLELGLQLLLIFSKMKYLSTLRAQAKSENTETIQYQASEPALRLKSCLVTNYLFQISGFKIRYVIVSYMTPMVSIIHHAKKFRLHV